jgi:hypothetical protein
MWIVRTFLRSLELPSSIYRSALSYTRDWRHDLLTCVSAEFGELRRKRAGQNDYQVVLNSSGNYLARLISQEGRASAYCITQASEEG